MFFSSSCLLCSRLGLQYLQERSVKCFEISVAEAHNQLATYRGPIPENEEALERIAQSPIKFRPRPCFEEDVSTA